MHDVTLAGCRPEPLAAYLKALGVLRLVAEQADRSATGRWEGDTFVLSSTLDVDGLIAFFARDYTPSPVLAAWNGAGGLFKQKGSKDPETGAVRFDKATTMTRTTDALSMSAAPRLAAFRRFVGQCRAEIEALGLETKPEKDDKLALIRNLRDVVADDALPWLDAAVLVGDEYNAYPPLLGTGGNDGKLDFGNNLQQRLFDVMDLETGAPTEQSEGWLRAALFAEPTPGVVKASVGQFLPSSAGGANDGTGFSGSAQVNPWDFVLFMEGALVMAGAATKRLESGTPGALSYPFTVRATGAGSASSSDADVESGRDEIWLPLWSAAATFGEVRSLFSEGRITVGRRAARDAVDVARALGTLGVDRGIDAFVRYAFLKRNGLSFLATPLGRWEVSTRPEMDLIDAHLDRWIGRVRRAAQDKNATATLRAANNRIARAIMDLARTGGAQRVQEILIALAQAEALAVRSPSLRESIPPVPALGRRWLRAADDGSVEFRLALALVEGGIRRRIVPLDPDAPWSWASKRDPGVVWARGSMEQTLLAVVRRDESELSMESSAGAPVRVGASAGDVACFLERAVADHRILELTEALALTRRSRRDAYVPKKSAGRPPTPPMPLWSLAALAWDQRRPHIERRDNEATEGAKADSGSRAPRSVVGLVAAGTQGDGRQMSRIAIRKLRPGALVHRQRRSGADSASAVPALEGLAVGEQHATRSTARRVAASLAFPLSDHTLEQLAQQVFHTSTEPTDPSKESS